MLTDEQIDLIITVSFYIVGIFIHLKENTEERNNILYHNEFIYSTIKIIKISLWSIFLSKKLTNYYEELILNNSILGIIMFLIVGDIINSILIAIVSFIVAIIFYSVYYIYINLYFLFLYYLLIYKNPEKQLVWAPRINHLI